MRFPSLSELDRDQKAIYNGAPPMESILVMGPPGTGKTVMAFHRAAVLHSMGVGPQVIMFSSVLSRYTKGGSGSIARVPVATMHSWVWHWWKRCAGTRSRPPSREDNSFELDWPRIVEGVMSRLLNDGIDPGKAQWGHLIVDEGQDFPHQMYQALQVISAGINELGHKAPAITVFADDNQRLKLGSNSSLEQIKQALCLSNESGRIYRLRKNYRNTRPIAEFAGHFEVGHQTGTAELPGRTGPKPRVSKASGLEAIRRHLATYIQNNPGKEIGIFCPGNTARRKLYNSLRTRLSDTDTHVQTYGYVDKGEHPVNSLRFDKGDVVTVLNFQSAKGLEFDSVFIIDPFAAYQLGGGGEQAFKMQMYVLCSRARTYLEMILQAPESDGLLPPSALFDKETIG